MGIAATIAGAQIAVIFNNNKFGFVDSFSFEVDENTKSLYALDSIIPAEIHPTTFAVKLSMSGFRTDQATLSDLGLFAIAGDNIIKNYNSLTIINRKNNAIEADFKAIQIDTVRVSYNSKGVGKFDISATAFMVKQDDRPTDNTIWPNTYNGSPITLVK